MAFGSDFGITEDIEFTLFGFDKEITRLKYTITRLLVLALFALLILKISSIPNIFEKLPSSWSKGIMPGNPDELKPYEIVGALIHFGQYLVLSVSLCWVIIYNKKANVHLLMIILVSALCFAYFDETYQTFIPGRGFQYSDLFFDAAGSIVGIYIYLLMRKWLKTKEQTPSKKNKAFP